MALDREACEQHRVDLRKLMRGGIVGIADIIDCVSHHPSHWFEGPYGFVLRNRQALPFIRWRGAQGLRDAPTQLIIRLSL